jgi:hypothetical protein
MSVAPQNSEFITENLLDKCHGQSMIRANYSCIGLCQLYSLLLRAIALCYYKGLGSWAVIGSRFPNFMFIN